MKKLLLTILCVGTLTTLGLAGAFPKENSIAKTEVKIGVVLPLTGNNGYLGENARNGILLRMKEMSKDAKFDYKLIFEDDEFSPAKTNLAARKLVKFDKVDVLISLWGYGYNIVMPVLKDSKVLHLSLDAWMEPSGYPYDFVLCASYQDYAQKMAEAVQASGTKTAVFFGVASSDEKRYFGALRKYLTEKGIKVLDEHYTNFDVRDFRTYILKVRDLKPDIFISTAIQPMMEIVLRQMKEIDYHPILAAGSANFLDISDKKLVEGGFYILTAANPGWFVDKYQSVYKNIPQYPSANGYDTFSLLVDACEKLPSSSKPTAEEISAELRKTKNYSGALGEISFVSPNKLPSPVVCYLIRNGKPQAVSMEELNEFYKNNKEKLIK